MNMQERDQLLKDLVDARNAYRDATHALEFVEDALARLKAGQESPLKFCRQYESRNDAGDLEIGITGSAHKILGEYPSGIFNNTLCAELNKLVAEHIGPRTIEALKKTIEESRERAVKTCRLLSLDILNDQAKGAR